MPHRTHGDVPRHGVAGRRQAYAPPPGAGVIATACRSPSSVKLNFNMLCLLCPCFTLLTQNLLLPSSTSLRAIWQASTPACNSRLSPSFFFCIFSSHRAHGNMPLSLFFLVLSLRKRRANTSTWLRKKRLRTVCRCSMCAATELDSIGRTYLSGYGSTATDVWRTRS